MKLKEPTPQRPASTPPIKRKLTTAEIIQKKRRLRAREPKSGVTIQPDGGGFGPDVSFGKP